MPTVTPTPEPTAESCFADGLTPTAFTTEPTGTTSLVAGGIVVHVSPLPVRDCVESGEIRVVATEYFDAELYTPPTSAWYDLADFADGGDIALTLPAGSYYVFVDYVARAAGEPDLESSFYVNFGEGGPAAVVVPATSTPATAKPAVAKPAAVKSGPHLAETGADASAPLAAAGLLLAAGAALVIGRRRAARA